MRDRELSERPYLSLRPFCRMVAASSEGGRLVELDGVIATIVPVAPERSVVNSAAYGFDGDFTRAFGQRPKELNLYAARIAGEAVACVGSIYEDGDCGIYLVATHPAARGRGLARELTTAALADARAAGCESASLQ